MHVTDEHEAPEALADTIDYKVRLDGWLKLRSEWQDAFLESLGSPSDETAQALVARIEAQNHTVACCCYVYGSVETAAADSDIRSLIARAAVEQGLDNDMNREWHYNAELDGDASRLVRLFAAYGSMFAPLKGQIYSHDAVGVNLDEVEFDAAEVAS